MRSIILMLVVITSVLTPVYAKEKAGTQTGVASYYAKKFHGRKTANGERFNNNAFTCAHRKHRFNTILSVTLARNGKTTYCRVNDRGPFSKKRIVDLSQKAARDIGMIHAGLARVKVKVHCRPGKGASKYNAKKRMVKCVENP